MLSSFTKSHHRPFALLCRFKADLTIQKKKRWNTFNRQAFSMKEVDFELSRLSPKLFLNPGIATKAFMKDAVRVHGTKYIYSQTKVTKNLGAKVTITCPTHGDFHLSLVDHLFKGRGCPSCNDNVRLPVSEFLLKTNNAERKLLLAQDILDGRRSFAIRASEHEQGQNMMIDQQQQQQQHTHDDKDDGINNKLEGASGEAESDARLVSKEYDDEGEIRGDAAGQEETIIKKGDTASAHDHAAAGHNNHNLELTTADESDLIDPSTLSRPPRRHTPRWARDLPVDTPPPQSFRELSDLAGERDRKSLVLSLRNAELTQAEDARANDLLLAQRRAAPPVMGALTTHGLDRRLGTYQEEDRRIVEEAQASGQFVRGEREALKGSLDAAMTTFMDDAKKALGDERFKKIDFEGSVYLGPHRAMEAVCTTHGTFTTTPANVVVKRLGCPKCDADKAQSIKEKALKKFRERQMEEQQS